MSTPISDQGICAGSRSEKTRMLLPSTSKSLPLASTSPGYAPYVVSYLSRWALVLASVKSFTAAISNVPGCLALVARRTKRPILPNPLIPTRVVNSHLRNFGDSAGLGALWPVAHPPRPAGPYIIPANRWVGKLKTCLICVWVESGAALRYNLFGQVYEGKLGQCCRIEKIDDNQA